MHDWRRRLGRGTVALLVLGLVPAVATLAEAERRKLLATQVAWVDTAGHSGTMLFQGTVEDGTLAGRAYPGGGTAALVVSGTVDAEGDVAGALHDAGAQLVGTFTASLDADANLDGALQVDGELDCLWAAPASQLPTAE